MSRYLTPRFYADLYAALAGLIVIIMLLSYPPMRSPHEWQHYLRGFTFSALYKNGTLPLSLFEFAYKAQKIPPPETRARLSPIPPDAAQIELNETIRTPFVSHQNVAVYPFIDYVPSIISGTLGEWFHLKPVTIYSLLRTLSLLSGVAFGYLILRLLPAYHVPMLVALLLPSGWFTRIQGYPDYVVNIAAFLYFALLVRLLYRGTRIDRRHIAAFLVTGVVLSASKTVYFPLTFSILLIPTFQFGSLRRRIVCTSIIAAFSICASFLAIAPTLHGTIAATGTTGEFIVPATVAETLWQEPLSILKKTGDTYGNGPFWKDKIHGMFLWAMPYSSLLEPWGIYPLLLALLPFVLCPTNANPLTKAGYSPRSKDRIVLFIIVMATAMLIAIALYDTYPTHPLIYGIQGRYFVPLLPFIALGFSFRLPERWHARCILPEMIVSLTILGILYAGISATGWDAKFINNLF